jgi:hypothetical protein
MKAIKPHVPFFSFFVCYTIGEKVTPESKLSRGSDTEIKEEREMTK